MRTRKTVWLFVVTILCWWASAAALPVAAQGADVLVMVVNRNNTSAANMKLETARKLVLGDISVWGNGTRVMVLLGPPDSNERRAILRKVCGMTEIAYAQYQAQAPRNGTTTATIHVVQTESELKNYIRGNPSAFGFVHKSQLDEGVLAVYELP